MCIRVRVRHGTISFAYAHYEFFYSSIVFNNYITVHQRSFVMTGDWHNLRCFYLRSSDYSYMLGWATLPVLKREGIDLSRNV